MANDYVLKFNEGDQGVVIDSFTDDEAKILEKSMSNASSNVFAWKQSDELSSEQIGALLSRYSRTALNGRRLFLKEFYPNRDRGREFFDAWLVDYGDDSIQEMVGGLPMACEFMSNLAVKEIEDSRLGSYIEKSTRYVAFDRKLPNGQYMFYQDTDILASRYGDRYLALMNGLFTSYSGAMERMSKHIRDTNSINEIGFRMGGSVLKITEINSKTYEQNGVTEDDLKKAYENAIKANALDFLRDYLPMATLTHVGMSMNARSYENMLQKMMSSPLGESRFIAKRMSDELRKLVPSLVKRVDDGYGAAFQKFLDERMRSTYYIVRRMPPPTVIGGDSVNLVEYNGIDTTNPDARAQVALASTILYKFSSGLSMSEAQETAGKMSEEDRKKLIFTYVGKRTNRRHKPGRAFENLDYQFDLKGRVGIYRDIQRHRIGTQERQNFGISLGYEIRDAFRQVGIAEDYKSKMEEVKQLYAAMHETLPFQAQYVVTFGFNTRWYYRLNARQLYHLCELRSTPQGHPDYRALVQAMALKVRQVHPTVVEPMKYLDMSEKVLGRLDSEIRIAIKKAQISQPRAP